MKFDAGTTGEVHSLSFFAMKDEVCAIYPISSANKLVSDTGYMVAHG